MERSSTPRLDRLYGGYLLADDGLPHDGETFDDWEKWLVEQGYHGALEPLHSTNTLKMRVRDIEDMKSDSEGRRLLTAGDPMSFILTTVPKVLEHPTFKTIGFNDFVLWSCREAYLWQWPLQKLRREVGAETPGRFVAPIGGRGSNKTGMFARALPLWAAAHKHIHLFAFAAANRDKLRETQNWWTDEFEQNEQLIVDFPDLVRQLPRKSGYIDSLNGFTMVTRSLNQEWRGTNAHGRRPDLGVTDDIDAPDEGSIEDRVQMLNADFRHTGRDMRAYLLGTNRSPGNVTDSLLTKARRGQEAAPDWTKPWRPIHFSATPISRITNMERSFGEQYIPYDDGTEESLVYLRANDPTYAQEIENEPYGADSVWWTPADIHLLSEAEVRSRFSIIAVSVDPAGGGTKKDQDTTGITVTAFDPHTGDSCVIWDGGGKWDINRIRQCLKWIDDTFHPNLGIWEGNYGGGNNMQGTVAPTGQDKWITAHPWVVVYQSIKTGFAESQFSPASKEARFSFYLRLFKSLPPKVFLLGVPSSRGELECAVPTLKAQLLAYSHTIKVKGQRDRIDSGATATRYLIDRFKPQRPDNRGIQKGW